MLSIRPMQQGDAAAVHRISSLSFSSPWSLQAIQDEFDHAFTYYLLAEDEEGVAGFVGAWLVAGEVQITNIAVDPQKRQRGIGRLLLEQLIQDMQHIGMAEIFLEVRISNTAAKSLYESLGFQYAGLRRGFYENNEDAHVMNLALEEPGT